MNFLWMPVIIVDKFSAARFERVGLRAIKNHETRARSVGSDQLTNT